MVVQNNMANSNHRQELPISRVRSISRTSVVAMYDQAKQTLFMLGPFYNVDRAEHAQLDCYDEVAVNVARMLSMLLHRNNRAEHTVYMARFVR